MARDMREIDGEHVAGDDGGKRRVPGKARTGQGDVDPVAGRAEQVPAAPERIGQERNDVLPLDQQEDEIMRDVIADGDRHQREGEAARDVERGAAGRHATRLMTAQIAR